MEQQGGRIRKTGYRRKTLGTLAVVAIALVAVSTGVGYRLGKSQDYQEPHLHADGDAVLEATAGAEVWTCSMHPQIRQPKPGQCPICAMDLIPVTTEATDEATGMTELKLSPRARKLAEIQTSPVERKAVSAEVRLAGKIEYDETRLSYITAWVPGRLDRLFVNYTGVAVKKGEPLVEIYSPELLAAQEELIQAKKALTELNGSRVTLVRETTEQLVEAAKDKLSLWGLTDKQISEIETRDAPSPHTTIYAPTSGVVVQKSALEGDYVKTGTRIYTIADLAHLWVKLDAYESDLQWIRLGQQVDFHTEAYPSETFKGDVVFIDPILDPATRTAKVRVHLDNRHGRLKPQMFVHAVVHGQVATQGTEPLPLVIPASAPLLTGKRAVVYVEQEPGLYEGREVVLGPRAGDYYLVREGLAEGERVVTNGNFKIDSAIQILAKPSMMNSQGRSPESGEHEGQGVATTLEAFSLPAEFKAQLDGVYSSYLEMHRALSHDELGGARAAAEGLKDALDETDMNLLDEPAHSAWMKELQDFGRGADELSAAGDIADARIAFQKLSEVMYSTIKHFGTSGKVPAHRFYCPMAFDNRGAYWLQNTPEIANPYYGSVMLKCGELSETIIAGNPEMSKGVQAHD